MTSRAEPMMAHALQPGMGITEQAAFLHSMPCGKDSQRVIESPAREVWREHM